MSFALYGYSADGICYRYPAHPDTLSEAQARAALRVARKTLGDAGCMTVERGEGFEAFYGDERVSVRMQEVSAVEYAESA